MGRVNVIEFKSFKELAEFLKEQEKKERERREREKKEKEKEYFQERWAEVFKCQTIKLDSLPLRKQVKCLIIAPPLPYSLRQSVIARYHVSITHYYHLFKMPCLLSERRETKSPKKGYVFIGGARVKGVFFNLFCPVECYSWAEKISAFYPLVKFR